MIGESSAVESSEIPDSSLRLTNQIRRRIERNAERDRQGRFWTVHGGHIKDYERSFSDNLSGSEIKDLLRNRTYPVVLDLMAPSDTLADLFRKASSPSLLKRVPFLKNKVDEAKHKQWKFSLGLAISLEDKRTQKQIQRDKNLNIEQITGDIMQSSVWRVIYDRLQGRKVDLVLERGEGGVEAVPINKKYYAIVLQKVWQMLNENGGTVLFQTPSAETLKNHKIPIKEWIEMLKANSVDVNYIPRESKSQANTGSLKIIKRPDSPQQLPLLE